MINNLQVLRAFAALNIVLCHAVWMTGSYGAKTTVLQLISDWAVNGVDVFFVISGFVMFYIQNTNPRSPIDFFKNRIKRIVPLYWTVTLIFTAAVLLLPVMFRQATFDSMHTLTSLLFVSHAAGFAHPVLVPGWTLEFEMLFYVLFAVAAYIKPVPPILTASVLLAVTHFLFGVHAIILEFILGMLAGYLYVNQRFKSAGYLMLGIGVLGLFSSIFYTIDLSHRVLVWGLPAFFLVLGSCYIRQIGRGFLVLLGSASYGIYLMHTLTLPIYFKLIKVGGLVPRGLWADLSVLGCMAFTAAVGVVIYRFYERPVDRVLSQWHAWPLLFRFGARAK